jgi:tetratricopeptide (TPR) repeat protein
LLLQVYQDTRNEVKGDSLANILMTEKQSKSLVSSLIHYYQSLNSNAKLISYFRTAYKNKYLHDEEIISYISALYSDEKFSVEKDYNLIDSLSTIIISNPTSYLLLADLNIKAKKFSLAADCVMKYISIEPNLNFKLYEQLLILLNSSKRYNELDSISTIAIQKFPYEATPFIFKGLSAFNTQKYRNAAVLMIDKFSILNKANSEEKNTIYEFIADLSYKAGMKDTSYLYYNKLIESNSASLIIKNNYAYYLALDSVNLDFADSLSLITVKNDPKNPTFLDTYAWIMYKKGDLKKAKFYIDKAIKYSSPSKALYEHARDIYRELNLLDKAKYFQLKSDETTAE